MLEVFPTWASVVTCVADETAFDGYVPPAGVRGCRIAPDEMLLVAPTGRVADVVHDAVERVAAADPDALVLDTTDGWTVWTIEGGDVGAAFSRLSAIRLPDEGFAQGDVARVPVKVIRESGRVHFLVPSMWREHLRERIMERCRSLGVVERTEPVAWTFGVPEVAE